MTEPLYREKLTTKNIKSDITRLSASHIFYWTLAVWLTGLCVFLFPFILSIRLWGVVYIIICAATTVFVILRPVYKIVCLQRGKYKVVTDKFLNYEGITAHFSSGRKFTAPLTRYGRRKTSAVQGDFYKWSRYCCDMSEVLTRNTIGDEFYTIVIGKRIVYVYNTKMFELI